MKKLILSQPFYINLKNLAHKCEKWIHSRLERGIIHSAKRCCIFL